MCTRFERTNGLSVIVPLTVIGGLACAEWRKERQSVNDVKYFGKTLYFTLGRSSRRVVLEEAGLDQTRTLSVEGMSWANRSFIVSSRM